MPVPDFESLVEDDSYLVNLGDGVWLMDNHRWALQVWESERKCNSYSLIHADYHWDAIYDFHDSPDEEADLIAASVERVCELVSENEWIRYDSFIAPAIKRGLIHTVHFYCLQDGPGDNALDEEFLSTCGAKQIFYTDAYSLASAHITEPKIFDLCLDLFNRSEQFAEGDLWSDTDISKFLDTVEPLIKDAEIVTVSMSFNCSGTEADTRHLSQLVLPKILEFRK